MNSNDLNKRAFPEVLDLNKVYLKNNLLNCLLVVNYFEKALNEISNDGFSRTLMIMYSRKNRFPRIQILIET